MASDATSPRHEARFFTDAVSAVQYARHIYDTSTSYLREGCQNLINGRELPERISANYPYVAMDVDRKDLRRHDIDRRLSHGFVSHEGRHSTTLTRPDFFEGYYTEQLNLLLKHHRVPIEVGVSDTPIPLHFAYPNGMHIEGRMDMAKTRKMESVFDMPNLSHIDDGIADGTASSKDGSYPLALFTAPRVDVSLQRIRHYTGTAPEQFQNFIIFTNYDFYIQAFKDLAKEVMSRTEDPGLRAYRSQYNSFSQPGGHTTFNANFSRKKPTGELAARTPQMPAYHLTREDGNGISLVNIGVGPSNAKNITDHLAVLRPHAWIMVGHCAGLSPQLELGDYVLAHAYSRKDRVLDEQVPLDVPIPALSEVQNALKAGVEQVTGRSGEDVRELLRTGTIITTADRNWEHHDNHQIVRDINVSRAIALDMESATIATNGLRFCVPYGTLLCVSDKPLQGSIKLPGMANDFYREQTGRHLEAGIRAMELLRENIEFLHSRKLSPPIGRAFL